MPATIHVLSTLPLSDEAQVTIRGIDARIHLHVLSRDARRRFRNAKAEVADVEAADREIREAVARSEVWYTFGWEEDQLSPGSALRWIQYAADGVEHLLAHSIPDGVRITNMRGVMATGIGEWVLAFMLMHAKGMPFFLEQQREGRWERRPTHTLRGATVGIVGLGTIGAEVARLSHALRARVIATKRSARPDDRADHCDTLYPLDQLPTLLSEADYVVIAVPITDETRGSFGANQFRAMRPEGVLINIARGAVVDQAAMVAALQSQRIAAVYTDVLDLEPLPDSDPLWSVPNLYITPHNSGDSPTLFADSAAAFTENLRRYVAGEPLENVVDRALGY